MPQEQKAVEQEDRSKKTKKQKFRDISSNTGDINIEDKVQFAVDAKRQGKNADEIFGMIMERTQMEIASKRKKELEKKFPPATVKKLLEDYLESESYQELVMETMSSVLTSIKAAKKRGEFNRTLQLNEQRQEQRKEQADKAIKNAEAQRQKLILEFTKQNWLICKQKISKIRIKGVICIIEVEWQQIIYKQWSQMSLRQRLPEITN